MLAAALNAVVLIPDFFKGQPAQASWIPADTEEKKQAFADFRATRADLATNVGVLGELLVEAKRKYPSARAWGAYGLCWGGKVGRCVIGIVG